MGRAISHFVTILTALVFLIHHLILSGKATIQGLESLAMAA